MVMSSCSLGVHKKANEMLALGILRRKSFIETYTTALRNVLSGTSKPLTKDSVEHPPESSPLLSRCVHPRKAHRTLCEKNPFCRAGIWMLLPRPCMQKPPATRFRNG